MRKTECTALPEMQGLHTTSAALTHAKYIFKSNIWSTVILRKKYYSRLGKDTHT